MVAPWVILIIFVIIVVSMAFFSALIATETLHIIRNDATAILAELENKLETGLAYKTSPTTIIAYGNDLPTNIPSSTEFSLPVAQFCGRLILSVLNEALGSAPLYPPQFEKLMVIGDTQAVLFRRVQSSSDTSSSSSFTSDTNTTNQFYVLCFRGSLTIQDIQADLVEDQIEYRDLEGKLMVGGRVAKGPYGSWIQLKRQLLEVQSMIGPNDTLLMCGHSLGSILTTFTCESFSNNIDPNNICYYCYETLSIGNNTFITNTEDKIPNHWYIRNMSDIIPDLSLPVTITTQGVSLYSYPRRMLLTNGNTGSVANNHYIGNNLCFLDANNPVPECTGDYIWVNEAQILEPN